ncbi:MAG: hypothetical protein EU547_05630 [Promethearchaeota archaeon]|nr:MAG: hypothetical protein EU547_05630 [Candidatus Lokiarchaeota archaeon]
MDLACKIKIRDPNKLTNKEIDEMFKLYSPHHNVTFESFFKRIKIQFTDIFIFRTKINKKIVGFLGISITRLSLSHSDTYTTFYLGAGYMHKLFRRNRLIQKGIIKLAIRAKFSHLFDRFIIWYDALNYKAYLIPAKYTREYYPNPFKKQIPPSFKRIKTYLGKKRYGDAYNPETGIVNKSYRKLKDHVGIIKPKYLKNIYIRYFLKKNPKYNEGNGLFIFVLFKFPSTILHFLKIIIHKWLMKLSEGDDSKKKQEKDYTVEKEAVFIGKLEEQVRETSPIL